MAKMTMFLTIMPKSTAPDLKQLVARLPQPLHQMQGRSAKALMLPDNIVCFQRRTAIDLNKPRRGRALHHRFVLICALKTAVTVCVDERSIRLKAGEALLVGAQRAEFVGEAWGKHGDDAIDEVDAVGPFASFLVEGGAGQDVVGNIGDMNSEFDVTSGKFAEGNGVVEIAGGIGVDGDDQFGAEVFAADGVAGEFDGGEGGGFREGVGREGGGEIEFSND